MGSKHSVLSEEEISEYLELTYLTRTEIKRIYDRFREIHPTCIDRDRGARFPLEYVIPQFPEFNHNPFREQIFRVFSSQQDGCLSFHDILDLCSALGEDAPVETKAGWAFRIFDFDGDNCLNQYDIAEIIHRLTTVADTAGLKQLKPDEMKKVVDSILEECDLDKTGAIVSKEFIHTISKMPDFASVFRVRF